MRPPTEGIQLVPTYLTPSMCDTCLGWETLRELLHVIVSKQLPHVCTNRVNAPDGVRSVRGDRLRILHPNPVFPLNAVSFPVSDRLTD